MLYEDSGDNGNSMIYKKNTIIPSLSDQILRKVMKENTTYDIWIK